MSNFKGFAWNCGGLRCSATNSRKKVMFFEKEFKNDFDVFFFVETHHKSEEEIPEQLLRYKSTHHIIHSPCAPRETHSGIIGLLSNEYEIANSKELIQGRLLCT